MFRPLKIATYLKGMAQLGISAEAVLEKSGIEAEKIQLPDYLISHEQYSMVVRNMIRLTGNPGVSFSVGKISDINDYGIIGYAMMSSNTLGDATDVWIKFSNSMIGEPIKTSWQTLGLGHELTFMPPPYSGDLYIFEIEELLAQGIKIITSLTGVRPIFDRVSFAYPAPSHLNLYKETFNCQLEFDAPRTSARILTPNFDHPITTKNQELYAACSLFCNGILESSQKTDPLIDRLRSIFLKTPNNLPALPEAADQLYMSGNTLLRHLEKSGTSYQELKDQFRFELAKKYLNSGNMQAKQVSYLLGFSSPSNFSRAFKTWSNQSVREFKTKDTEPTHSLR